MNNDNILFDYQAYAKQSQLVKILPALYERLTHYPHAMLLVNPRVAEKSSSDQEWLAALKKRDLDIEPWRITHPNLSKSIRPLLVPLDLRRKDDQILLAHSIERALDECSPSSINALGGRIVCGWLASEYPVQEIAYQLGFMALQSKAHKNITFLRCYDPAVTPQLWRIMDPICLTRFFYTVDYWALVDGDGQFQFMEHGSSAEGYLSSKLPFTKTMWAQIDLIGVINQCLREYRLENQFAPRFSERTVFDGLFPFLLRLQPLPFIDEKRLLLSAKLALTHRIAYDLHPHYQALLQRAYVQDAFGYQAFLMSINASQWEQMKAETPTPLFDSEI